MNLDREELAKIIYPNIVSRLGDGHHDHWPWRKNPPEFADALAIADEILAAIT